MKDAHWRLVGVAGILFFILAVAQDKRQEIQIGEAVLRVEIADTQQEQAQGLSGRAQLPENRGMLFVFQEPGRYGFWMKDMKFSIDIVWIDEGKRVVGVERNIAPETFPETFYPPSPIQYVLEAKAGFAERNSIAPGDMLDTGP